MSEYKSIKGTNCLGKIHLSLDKYVDAFLDPANGEKIYKGRNLVRLHTLNGEKVVSKYYYPSVSVKYGYYLKKVRGSFETALLMRSKGIATPKPLGWLSCKKRGFCFVYRYIPNVVELRYILGMIHNYLHIPWKETPEEIIWRVARFVRNMHDKGFWHRDLSGGNILINKTEIYVVDISRVRIKKVSDNDRFRDLSRLPIFNSYFQKLLLFSYSCNNGISSVYSYKFFHSFFHGRHEAKNLLKRLKKDI